MSGSGANLAGIPGYASDPWGVERTHCRVWAMWRSGQIILWLGWVTLSPSLNLSPVRGRSPLTVFVPVVTRNGR